MSALFYICFIVALILLCTITYVLYNILQDTDSKTQMDRIGAVGSWTLGIGITILVLIVILVASAFYVKSIMDFVKASDKILGIMFGLGILLLIIGWQIKAIQNNSTISADVKKDKITGFTITMAAISGLMLGLLIGTFVSSPDKSAKLAPSALYNEFSQPTGFFSFPSP